jgi:hypothetical protein
MSVDDLLSDETQGGQTIQQPMQKSYKMEMNRCPNNLSLDEKNPDHMLAIELKRISVDDKIAKKMEDMITEKQKIPNTRFNERVQAQLEKKDMNQVANPKKRFLSGTNLTSQNSFAALGNEIIANIACDMGIDMSFF